LKSEKRRLDISMKRYGFAIVGTGLIARFHARAVRDVESARLIAVCSRSEERAREFAAEFDCQAFTSVDEMLALASVDVLLVATPSGAHLAPAVAAAHAGVHALVEKPLEITVDRARKMIDAHADAGTSLGCIFQLRHISALQPIRQALRSGRFGTLTHGAVYVPWWREQEYYTQSEWHGSRKLDGGGALMNQSIHMIDILCDLMPPVQSVSAFVSSIGHPGIEVEDAASASLIFEGGALGTVVGTTSAWPGRPKRLEITGTCGTAILEDDNLLSFQFRNELPQDEQIRAQFAVGADCAGAADPGAMSHRNHTACVQAFVDALASGTPYAVDGVAACRSIALIEAIYQSAAEGCVVRL